MKTTRNQQKRLTKRLYFGLPQGAHVFCQGSSTSPVVYIVGPEDRRLNEWEYIPPKFRDELSIVCKSVAEVPEILRSKIEDGLIGAAFIKKAIWACKQSRVLNPKDEALVDLFRRIITRKLTRKFFLALPDGVFLCGNHGDYADTVCPRASRLKQWQAVPHKRWLASLRRVPQQGGL